MDKKKPDPTIYKKASEMLGVAPENCLVVEDSIIGLKVYPFLLPLFPYFNWSIIERRGTFNIHSKTNYQVKTCTESCTYSAHPCLPCDKNHQLIFVILRLNSVLYAQLWGFWYQAASAAGMSCIISYTSSTSKQVLQLPNLTARTLFLAF